VDGRFPEVDGVALKRALRPFSDTHYLAQTPRKIAMEVDMPVPMEPDAPTWRWIALAAIAAVQALLALMVRNFRDEQKSLAERVSTLELTPYVTREEVERHIGRLEAAGLRMHTDNKDALRRIEEKLEHGGETRHGILDGVSAVQLMLRRTLEELKQERDRNKP
jgi:hypothetical protein